MVTIISQNVPMCPECKGMMSQRHQNHEMYYFCHDCLSIYQFVGNGQAENELVVRDSKQKESRINETVRKEFSSSCFLEQGITQGIV